MKLKKTVASDQETLVSGVRTYVYGLEQRLGDLRVQTSYDVATVRQTQALVDDSDQVTRKALDAAVKRISSDGSKKKARVQRQIRALKRAIEVIEENHDLVRPNLFRVRRAILEVMDTSRRPVSAKQIIEYLSLCGLLIDRRRLSIRLRYMKAQGVATNPIHGGWTLTEAGKQEFKERQEMAE